MATNLVAAGRRLVVYDAAGTEERAPEGTEPAGSSGEVGQRSTVVLFSLPDGEAVLSVARELARTRDYAVRTVVDTSTIGMAASRRVLADWSQVKDRY